jgi:hypothetical protein
VYLATAVRSVFIHQLAVAHAVTKKAVAHVRPASIGSEVDPDMQAL